MISYLPIELWEIIIGYVLKNGKDFYNLALTSKNINMYCNNQLSTINKLE